MTDSESPRGVGVDPLPLDLAAWKAWCESPNPFDRSPTGGVIALVREVECLRTENAALRAAASELLDVAVFGGRHNPEFYYRKQEAITAMYAAFSGLGANP